MMGRDVRRDSVGPYRMPRGPTIAVPDTLAFLRGRWRLERRLDDQRCGVCGTFAGDAEFAATDDPAVLRYTERGELRFGGHNGPARRALLFRELPDGAADVRFADGREFYVLDLRSGQWSARHGCGADEYVVSYLVRAPGLLEERWHVVGPRKAYETVTTLRRPGSS
ncbi:MAG TPA: DUF6314 family protein [Streptosporangiaceae bacterium]|nr:DUF6314 family protein [Streptosporangiaceae bacterium]